MKSDDMILKVDNNITNKKRDKKYTGVSLFAGAGGIHTIITAKL